VLEALTDAAARLGVIVRCEDLDLGETRAIGGACRVRGTPVVLLDARSDEGERIRVLAAALRELDVDAVYLPPLVRRLVRPEESERGERDA
jgi:hypothetical protein